MEENKLSQLTYPLDPTTQSILAKFFLSLFTTFITSGGATGNSFAAAFLKLGNRGFAFGVYGKLITCTASSSTHKFTLGVDLTSGDPGTLSDDMFVTVMSPDPGDTPSGIDNGSGYFIVNASGNTVQLSATKGGSPILFTSNGTGPQYILF